MNKFLQYIPGFRSNVLWKKATASVYYLFCLLMLTVGFGAFLFFASIPFVVFSLVDLIQRNKKGIPLKRALIPFVLSLAIAITGLSMSPTTEDTKGPELSSPIAQEDQTQVHEQPASTETEEQPKPKTKDNTPVNQEGNTSETEKSDTSEEPQESMQSDDKNSNIPEESQKKPQEELQTKDSEQKDIPADRELKVHFIDVGQGDSIFIHTNSAAMLIDAGNNSDGPKIVNYIRNQGFNKLDYVIFTHPHADHIGGAVDVVNSFEIGKIIMPKVEHTTRTYENLLLAIQSKGLKITFPNPGDEYSLGSAKFKILAPNSSGYNDLNDYSVVTKLTFGQTSFLFTGDAESVSENEILYKGFDIKSDILKVGHHGSNSSTTEQFLSAVSPKYAVISVGAGNQYGHPTPETLARLTAHSVEVYRTDEVGTITATSDGEKIIFDKKASPVKPNAPPVVSSDEPESGTNNITVYITKTGTKYHRDGCRYLSKSKIPISLSDAVQAGYSSCSVCNPPILDNSSSSGVTTGIENSTTTYEENTIIEDNTSTTDSEDKKEITVYITKTGSKYHSAGCGYLRRSCIPIELSDAKAMGYTPCSRCHPPR